MGTQTTPDAMLESLADVVIGLTPAGGHEQGIGTERLYQKTQGDDWVLDQEDAPETELDRHFTFYNVQPQEVKILGGCEYDMWTGEVDLIVGHQIGEFRAARSRRDLDVHQLISQLIDGDSYPTGVHKIRLVSTDMTEIKDGLYWVTLIRFNIHYKLATQFGA
jgi:hypothetical protein